MNSFSLIIWYDSFALNPAGIFSMLSEINTMVLPSGEMDSILN